MKKTIRNFAVLTAITLGFFTSCVEDGESVDTPVITVTSPAADTISVASGDSVVFTLDLSSTSGLASLQTLTGVGVELTNGDKTFNASLTETVTVTAKVTDDATVGEFIEVNFTVANDSKQATVTKILSVVAKETPLSAAAAFEWKRVGGAAANGLEEFGLTWTSNTATNAVIKKGAAKFVELQAAQWTSIANLEALKAAIDGATDMEKWEKVSAAKSDTYDFTLGTIKDNVYYLIHVENGTVSTATAGTTIVITGNYKK